MGGRGASSSTRLSKEEIRQRNREYLAKRMEQGREVLRQSMQRDLENIKPYQDNTKTYTFDNRNNIINALREQTNVDLTKAVDDTRFSTRSRTYFDVDSRKLNQNEFNAMMRYLKYDHNVRIEANGAYHYAIYYKKNRR